MANPLNGFSDQRFWQKLGQFAVQAGKQTVETALVLYYTAQRPETPLWAKMTIYSALAYFILPADALPDIVPIAGYSDDLAALMAAIGAVAVNITPEAKAAAREKVEEWFGNPSPSVSQTSPNPDDTLRDIPID